MFNPLYIEIYQAAFGLLVAVTLSVALWLIHKLNREQYRLRIALNEAWTRERLQKLQLAKLEYPEDWALRGVPAEFENPTQHAHRAYRDRAQSALNCLSDEQLAAEVLLVIGARLWRNGVNDKVFTRLAGRIFRTVETGRKQRTFNSN